jgi:hypothetical protein
MLLLIAALAVHHHTQFLVADGAISTELVADPSKWLATRDAFIRTHAPADAKLPIVYKLDEDFVTAARTRQSIEVVDDCGDALCGVATDELAEDWEAADLRKLNLPPRPAKRGEGKRSEHRRHRVSPL